MGDLSQEDFDKLSPTEKAGRHLFATVKLGPSPVSIVNSELIKAENSGNIKVVKEIKIKKATIRQATN
jgi:hypothetical protein